MRVVAAPTDATHTTIARPLEPPVLSPPREDEDLGDKVAPPCSSTAEPPTPSGAPAALAAHAELSEGSNGGAAVELQPSAEERDAIILRMLDELMHYASDVFACCAAEGPPVYIYVSPSVKAALGWEAAQLVNRNLFELTHPDDVERIGKVLAKVVDGSEPCAHVMHRSLHADGSYRWFHSHICRQDDLLLSVARDASQYKNTEAALREYLLATSHDLRTPCHGIMTAVQLLAAREGVAADAEAAFLVQAVQSGCSLMLNLIQNTLEMRSISAPGGGLDDSKALDTRLSLKPRSFALHDLIATVLQNCRVGCGLLRGKLDWSNEADALPTVVADTDRLTQILQARAPRFSCTVVRACVWF